MPLIDAGDLMNEISLKKTKESVRSCNGCYARNYDSSFSLPGEKVDLLFELTIGSQQVCLCERCLNRLHDVVFPVIGNIHDTPELLKG